MHPVPFQNKLTISLKNIGLTKIQLYSLEGRKVFEKSFNPTTNINSFEIPEISKGIYVAKISDASNKVIEVKKVIKS